MSNWTPIPNPYVVGNPLKTTEMFFGREKTFQVVRQSLSIHPNQIIRLLGERRSGKTSILHQINNGRLGDNFFPVYIDLQAIAGVKDNIDFYQRLLIEINNCLKAKDFSVVDVPSNIKESAWIDHFRNTFTDLKSFLGNKTVIFLIDEFDIIKTKIDDDINTGINKDILLVFESLLESSSNISLVLTGSYGLKTGKDADWNRFFSKSQDITISFLDFSEATDICILPVKDYFTYDDDCIEYIFSLTNGQPYFTQLLCQKLVNHLNAKEIDQVTYEILQDIVTSISKNPVPQMVYYWNSLTENQQYVLSLLAARVDKAGEASSAYSLIKDNKKFEYDLPITFQEMNEALDKLFHYEYLINKKDVEHDLYYYQMDIYRYWIKRDRSPWYLRQILDGGGIDNTPHDSLRGIKKYVLVALSVLVLILLGTIIYKELLVLHPTEPDLAPSTISEVDTIATTEESTLTTTETNTFTETQLNPSLDSLSPARNEPTISATEHTAEIQTPAEPPKPKKRKKKRPPTAQLLVNSEPDNAFVYLVQGSDTTFRASTPFANTVYAGAYTLIVEKEGYAKESETISLITDSIHVLPKYVLESQVGHCLIITGSVWVNVFVDGQAMGSVPGDIENNTIRNLATGHHLISFKQEMDDFREITVTKEIIIVKNDIVSIEITEMDFIEALQKHKEK